MPSMFDCPASTQRSPTNTGPTSFVASWLFFLIARLTLQGPPTGTPTCSAFEESDPIGKLFVGGRILVLCDDGCVHQGGVLGGLIEREGAHRGR